MKNLTILYKFIAFVATFAVSVYCLLIMFYFVTTDVAEYYPHIVQFKMFCLLLIGMWGLPFLLLVALQSLSPKKGK